MLQSFRLSTVLPLSLTSVTAPWSSASTQPLAPGDATARACRVGGVPRNKLASTTGCARVMITSTAVLSRVRLPDVGGLLTVTVTPALPSTYP